MPILLVAVVSALGCSGPSVETSSDAAVPAAVAAPAGETLAFSADARGEQIYACRPREDEAARFEWVLDSPQADLFDGDGRKIGSHYAGPTWESVDGSSVRGRLLARATVAADAIPWLLVAASEHHGEGVFDEVTSIQRVDTVGGQPPTPACDVAGEELRVPYTAVYRFFIEAP